MHNYIENMCEKFEDNQYTDKKLPKAAKLLQNNDPAVSMDGFSYKKKRRMLNKNKLVERNLTSYMFFSY